LANSLSALVNLCLLTAGVVLRKEGIFIKPLKGLGRFLGQVLLAVAGMSLGVNGYLQLVGGRFHG